MAGPWPVKYRSASSASASSRSSLLERRHPVGEGCVRVRPLEPPTAADEPVQLEEGEQEHQQLPARLDALAAEAVGKLLPSLVGPLRQGLEDHGGRAVETGAGQPVGVVQLPSDEGTDARSGQLQQPPDVLGRDEVPGRSQHVGADHAALVQQRLELGRVAELAYGWRPPMRPGSGSRPGRRAGSGSPPPRTRRAATRGADCAAATWRSPGRSSPPERRRWAATRARPGRGSPTPTGSDCPRETWPDCRMPATRCAWCSTAPRR